MRKRFTLLLVVMSLLITGVQARILRVNNTPGIAVEFTSFQDAYTEAQNGDTLYIEGSATPYLKYGSTFVINKKLTIFGPGYWLVENGIVNYGAANAKMGDLTTLDIKKEGVNIYGLETSIISINASKVVISRCKTGRINLGSVSEVSLHQNYIDGNLSGGYDTSSNVTVTNNIIIATSIVNFKSCVFNYNHIDCYTASEIYSTTFKNNIVKVGYDFKISSNCSFDETNYKGDWYLQCLGSDTEFKKDVDYQLRDDSDLLTKDPNGKQIGAFGGNDPYIISGVPNIPLIKEIDVSASANVADGLKVNLVITTNR